MDKNESSDRFSDKHAQRVSTMLEQTLKIRLTHNKNTTVYCAAKSA